MQKILIVDTETGGTNPNKHSLLTIGMIAASVEDGEIKIKEKIGLRVKHNKYVADKKALEVNKIDLAEHDKIAFEKDRVTEEIKKFISRNQLEKIPVLGQNINFDIGFLQEYLKEDYPFHYHTVDTIGIWLFLKMMGKVPSYMFNNLESMAKHFGIDYSKAHDALEDCVITLEVLQGMLNKISEI